MLTRTTTATRQTIMRQRTLCTMRGPRMEQLSASCLLLLVLLLVPAAIGCETSTRAPPKGDRSRRTNPILETEADVEKYLAERGKDVAILRCKNRDTVQWMTAVVPYVDLECEVLGSVRSVQWYNGTTLLDTGRLEPGHRYASTVRPHVKHGKFFSRWLDYTLRIHRVTEDDNGEYTLRVRGVGSSDAPSREERQSIRLKVVTGYQPKAVREQTAEQNSDAQKTAKQRRKKSQRGKQLRLLRLFRL